MKPIVYAILLAVGLHLMYSLVGVLVFSLNWNGLALGAITYSITQTSLVWLAIKKIK